MRNNDDDYRLSGRRFFRDKSRAWLSGVCAGIADYFGFGVGATRIVAIVALLVFPPMTFLAYVAMTFLVPARVRPTAERRDPKKREFEQAVRARPTRTLSDVHRRFQQLDARLATLERHVTSSRYRLDREFDRL
ncbi:MAG: envelope stress response membrane protein PspC [Pseudomonadota bacterium]